MILQVHGFGHMVYIIPLGGFVGACFYKSNHKGSCCVRKRDVILVG
jgi:hypothetical protein